MSSYLVRSALRASVGLRAPGLRFPVASRCFSLSAARARSLSHRLYTKEHEWIELGSDGKGSIIGITDFAQKQLGDIVFVDVSAVGKKLDKGDDFGTVESVKAVSELFAPVAGTVTEFNSELSDSPELINEDADDAWIIKMDVTDVKDRIGLLNSTEYDEFVASGSD